MKVSEIFTSIQGEGIYVGTPMNFLRLAGCNLRCDWCDTKYAWSESIDYDVDEVIKRIGLLPSFDWLCITGGEPLLQMTELEKLISNYLQAFSYRQITIETNGTILPSWYLLMKVNFWSVSPKLSNSGNKAINGEVLKTLWEKPSQFKFVVRTKEDIQEAMEVVESLKLTFRPIIFQPDSSEFISKGKLNTRAYLRRMIELKDILMSLPITRYYDVRLLPQLHVLMFGRKRAV